ncbi:MAG: NADH-quinone oxidoreductase subunit NuoE [Hyphomicrobium sp.]|uniref:NADH-quinone oxidoreductase subunit NuoE n=1 Tax=Hyphomicrobium sp. TaxID=82 RepID=UPI0039E71523
MAVRRLNPEQPAQFAFTAENLAWARETIAKYPDGKQASAIIPLMWKAQEQAGGWLPEPAIRLVCDMLGMAHIRGMEIATFYTMFQLSPVGSKAHFQVCGTTPCMLRGSGELIAVCKNRINGHSHETNADGTLSWEEVECIGVCANAPVVQVNKDTFEDLTAEQFEKIIDGFLAGRPPKPGSQIGRTASCPITGPTSLTDPTLYDGSTIGAWKKRFDETSGGPTDKPQETVPPSALASPAHKEQVATGTSPASPGGAPPIHPAALTAMANAGLVKELEARGDGKPLSAGELDKIKADMIRDKAIAAAAAAVATVEPELLKAPRGSADDLSLIWGVADKMVEKLNAIGIWHFDQIAKWSPENVAWFESQLDGFKGRVTRDKWIEQAAKLASGWRPENKAGERPKG